MSAAGEHAALYEFLSAWFAEADLERRDDSQVIDAYRRIGDTAGRAEVVRQGRALLASKRFPWRRVIEASNRRFDTAAACANWLADVLDAIER